MSQGKISRWIIECKFLIKLVDVFVPCLCYTFARISLHIIEDNWENHMFCFCYPVVVNMVLVEIY